MMLLGLVLGLPVIPALADWTQQVTDSSVSAIASENPDFSGDVTTCRGESMGRNTANPGPGYQVDGVQATETGGILAALSLVTECNAYGWDIGNLTLSVEYETKDRLHVHVYDEAQCQYQVPDSVLPAPRPAWWSDNSVADSTLQFEYNSSPFEFWVARKADGAILFDTRSRNIPVHNDAVRIEGNYSAHSVLPGYPLIFEDQYLQLASALPIGANIYGLGEVVVSERVRTASRPDTP